MIFSLLPLIHHKLIFHVTSQRYFFGLPETGSKINHRTHFSLILWCTTICELVHLHQLFILIFLNYTYCPFFKNFHSTGIFLTVVCHPYDWMFHFHLFTLFFGAIVSHHRVNCHLILFEKSSLRLIFKPAHIILCVIHNQAYFVLRQSFDASFQLLMLPFCSANMHCHWF